MQRVLDKHQDIFEPTARHILQAMLSIHGKYKLTNGSPWPSCEGIIHQVFLCCMARIDRKNLNNYKNKVRTNMYRV